jgi:hypothetical protein
MTDRNVFLGVHVTPRVKQLVEDESRDNTMSQSALVYEILVEHYRRKGLDPKRKTNWEKDMQKDLLING